MWGFVYNPRKLEPGCLLTSRDLGIEAMDDRLPRHRIHTDSDVAGPVSGDHRRGNHIPGPIPNCRNWGVSVGLQPPGVTGGRHRVVIASRYSDSR